MFKNSALVLFQKKGYFYLHAPVLIQGRFKRNVNQSNAFLMGGDLNAQKPILYILDGVACE